MIEYESFKKKYPHYKDIYLDEGSSAECFKLSDNEIYKSYKVPKANSLQKEWILYSEKLDYKYILFPRNVVVDSLSKPISQKIIYGYVSQYQKETLNESVLMSFILNEIKKLEKEIKELSKTGIKIVDLYYNNMICNDSIYLIDTDNYINNGEYNVSVEKENFFNVNFEVLKYLVSLYKKESTLWHLNHQVLLNNKLLKDLYKETMYGTILVSKFLEELIIYLEETNNININSLKDFRISLKLNR